MKGSLLLNPIQNITNDDRHYLESIHIGFIQRIEFFGSNVSLIMRSAMYEGEKPIMLSYSDADYLRSKGYALPYMNYSVDDLVENGLIKLKK